MFRVALEYVRSFSLETGGVPRNVWVMLEYFVAASATLLGSHGRPDFERLPEAQHGTELAAGAPSQLWSLFLASDPGLEAGPLVGRIGTERSNRRLHTYCLPYSPACVSVGRSRAGGRPRSFNCRSDCGERRGLR